MALWLPSNKFYIPQGQATRLLHTDEYVTRTNHLYHAATKRLMTVGHPYFEQNKPDGSLLVPKVSSLQYRCFLLEFPDPNKFVFPDQSFYDPETQRLVFSLVGLEISRPQPIGVGLSGNVLMDRLDDAEAPNKAGNKPGSEDKDPRVNWCCDPKQTQLIIVGCKPAKGEHWAAARPCVEDEGERANKCPPIERKSSILQDGDMMEAGFGNLDFKGLQPTKSEAPLDISQSICKSPDMLAMSQDVYGDELFFCVRQEQLFARHFFTHSGKVEEAIPKDYIFDNNKEDLGTYNYWQSPSGSLISSNTQIFNKPYWVKRAQGYNNGVLWHNKLFVTIGDTTRGTNFSISVQTNAEETYKSSNFNSYLRHVESFEIACLVQVCVVDLTPETISHIHQMDETILEEWNLGVATTVNGPLGEQYRFIKSAATKCEDNIPKDDKKDPWEKYRFWRVNLTDQLSQDLAYYPLGRRYLFQNRNALQKVPKKRKPTSNEATTKIKRRRKQI